MSKRHSPDPAPKTLRSLPTKWALAIVVGLILYVLLQPRLNDWFGWKLPSAAAMLGEEPATVKKPEPEKSDLRNEKAATEKSTITHQRAEPDKDQIPLGTTESRQTESELLHGFLQDIGRDRFESPAGLIYGPGSEEGHRLKHLERHLTDQPNRPGSHGVFRGTLDELLVAIDEAYSRAKRSAAGTSKRSQDGSMVYEANFEKAIGFLGGKEGIRRKKPPLKKLRVVVRGNSVITAFPF